MYMCVCPYLQDDEDKKVCVGNPEELFKEVEREECDDVVLGSHHLIGLHWKQRDTWLIYHKHRNVNIIGTGTMCH